MSGAARRCPPIVACPFVYAHGGERGGTHLGGSGQLRLAVALRGHGGFAKTARCSIILFSRVLMQVWCAISLQTSSSQICVSHTRDRCYRRHFYICDFLSYVLPGSRIIHAVPRNSTPLIDIALTLCQHLCQHLLCQHLFGCANTCHYRVGLPAA